MSLYVKHGVRTMLKTLSDKSREAKVKSKPRTVPYLPKYSAGLELLSRYEDTWAALHRRAKECASAGELVDSEVVMLSAHWEKKKTSLTELQEQLQQLPGLLADLESVTANLTHLETSFEEVENHLLHLEDLCGQCELERYKHVQSQQLENYKKHKRKELEIFKAELDAEHTQKVLEMEHAQQMKLRERQKFFEEAFQQDMEQYLSTGYLQIAERREPIGSMSSMEVNIDVLEQMDLMDISDQEALDVFLNSGGEENTVRSPGLGPESSTCPDEITLKVPSPSALQARPPSLSSTCTEPATPADASEGGPSPLVQSDEEEVQVDTALATLSADRKGSSDTGEDSDS
ncbi:dysbindin isoform X2 [Dasypus novemcinctus]|uniref:dysbindin isoform X2 n=1 Tax=Dasypus novemcinctus TaxID=9361 RepID=UPI000328CAB5|nr:dysbindin isoform X2 [Dasypus novemcinctus]